MKGHQLFIPLKASNREAQPTYGTDMRAIETAFNNLPTPGTGGTTFNRLSRYRVTATTTLAHSGTFDRIFKWGPMDPTVTRLYQSTTVAPTLTVGIAGTAFPQLVFNGERVSGAAPVQMIGTYILYLTFTTPGAHAAVLNQFRFTWTYTPGTILTIPKLIRDVILWPSTTHSQPLVKRSYAGALVATAETALWKITSPTLHTYITPSRTVGITTGTLRVLFTVILAQAALG